MRSPRACSMGSGNKTDLCGKSKSPPPNIYNTNAGLDNHNSSITFGKDRDSIKFGNFLDMVEKKRKFPGPNAYRMKLDTLSKKGGRIGIKLMT